MENIPVTQIITLAALFGVLALYYILKAQKKGRIQKVLAEGALVLDVRSPGEFAQGHYPQASNIPVDSLDKKLKSLGSTDRAIVVYCASGGRSSMAAAKLKAAGFTKVFNAGGLSSMPNPPA